MRVSSPSGSPPRSEEPTGACGTLHTTWEVSQLQSWLAQPHALLGGSGVGAFHLLLRPGNDEKDAVNDRKIRTCAAQENFQARGAETRFTVVPQKSRVAHV